jgi:hypothetical protein
LTCQAEGDGFMTATNTSGELLAEVVAVIEERLRDVASRGLSEWDGPPAFYTVDRSAPRSGEALAFIGRYGRKAGVRLSAEAAS